MESLVEVEDFPGRLLHVAALWDNAELLEDLLNGDEIRCLDARDSWGRSALHAAATNADSKCLRVLLQSGAAASATCGVRGQCRTPLHVASEHGHSANVLLLLESGASLLDRDALGLTPMDLAEKGDHKECMEILREAANHQEECRQAVSKSLHEACVVGDVSAVRTLLANLSQQNSGDESMKATVNFCGSGGNNTLLFKASEYGHKEIVTLLLDAGADGRSHPVTKYSPLYIACYNGHKEVAEILLARFPTLINELTVERWSPLHAACINGHTTIFEYLIRFPFKRDLLKKFKDKTGEWEYRFAFDVNQCDVTGQTVLYLACCVSSLKIVEILLNLKVKAKRIKRNNENTEEAREAVEETEDEVVGVKKKSSGIQALISRLRGTAEEDSLNEDETFLSPVFVDAYCNNGTETALHNAVRYREVAIATKLLAAGANPNLAIYAPETSPQPLEQQIYFKGSTVLVEACKNRDGPMIDILLKYSARDDDCKALYVASQGGDNVTVSRLLSLKANQDCEHSINRKGIAEFNHALVKGFAAVGSLAYTSIFPTTPVMVNWHHQGSCLKHLDEQYLVDAAVRLNPKLKLHPKFQFSAVHAITRLDVSANELEELPDCIWYLQSLRCLNAARNKLERLPGCVRRKVGLTSLRSARTSSYDCPVLEEVFLQDNRLETLPAALFALPSLTALDVSNNKLQHLPFEMWSAPALKELNLAFNLLTELPANRGWSSSASDQGQQSSLSSEASYDSDFSELTTFTESELSSAEVAEAKKAASLRAKFVQKAPLNHEHIWSSSLEVQEKAAVTMDDEDGTKSEGISPLVSLNLSHNSFLTVPKCLACLCPSLARLNLSYNTLAKCGGISGYPHTLKHLDLSHNQIVEWLNDEIADGNVCYVEEEQQQQHQDKKLSRVHHKLSSGVLHKLQQQGGCCSHRGHSRLDNLRTLVLSNNLLTEISYYGASDSVGEDDDSTSTNKRILFPALSMLDVSANSLNSIPASMSDLVNLSVLNVSDNPRVTDLPPQLGLLHKLWNLNTKGCNLQEPLLTMTQSKSYKTSDIVGYLLSVLENSRVYARLKLMVVGIQGIGKTTLLEQLRQEGGSFKRKHKSGTDHWARRMGIRTVGSGGRNMSTVGVDIGDWTFEKRGSNLGPCVFRTWDFGGQTEYYATHQYFLSRRSLYLVVWRMTDGEKGVNEIAQWLINIQSRAPNSPVVIVGTHLDVVRSEFPPSFAEYLQQRIRERFVYVADPEKCGLPKVLESVEVSCKTRVGVKQLANLLYDTAFSLRSPGSKTRLLEQKIPASYLALEDVVGVLAQDLKARGRDPVLGAEEYESAAANELLKRSGLCFRDGAELAQATKFLHENGLLLHYDDATLRDLYFLDPQWLCDVLSHVVTVREINPFARTGVMRLDDLRHVFKSSEAVSISARSYIVNLLNKFEVALTWDSRTLLIPSLLPTEQQMRSGKPGTDTRVKIAVRTRGWGGYGGGHRARRLGPTSNVNQLSTPAGASSRSKSVPSRVAVNRNIKISKPILPEDDSVGGAKKDKQLPEYEMSRRSEAEHCIRRLLLMSYFPSGFWSRLLTRVLGDDSVVEIVRSYFVIPTEMSSDGALAKLFIEQRPEWVCWQTGLELRYLDATLFSLRQVTTYTTGTPDYSIFKMMAKGPEDENWAEVDTRQSSILEVVLPQDTVVVKRPVKEKSNECDHQEPVIGYQALSLDPSPKAVCQLLALAVEHVDTLLEDWYPSLGTRFLHTSEGKMLVTRLVPCPRCLASHGEKEATKSWQDWSFLPPSVRRDRVSQESKDSGVGQDNSPRGSAQDVQKQEEEKDSSEPRVYSFLVEDCILKAFQAKNPSCPEHGDLFLGQIAPDTIFLDLEDRLRISGEHVKLGDLIGRGAFGFVYRAMCRPRPAAGLMATAAPSPRPVAVKMLQPINPGAGVSASTAAAYKANRSRWDRDPLQYACKAYCTARQELAILMHLRHSHIVPLVGVCANPLSVVLELAPGGALDRRLRHYRRSGDRMSPVTVRAAVLQVARALEYLHQHRIIYRDLKSENVLVWKLPEPFSDEKLHPDVHLKLADYGISRSTLPTGAKGFGGTEGFMAPEIVRYNGEEEYTEKVDTFSFGMFLYELLTLRQPFSGMESVKELILEGGRPAVTPRELCYPTDLLDLMVVCWSQQPRERPSASQLVSIASAPEFVHLVDVAGLDYGTCSARAVVPPTKLKPSTELWMTTTCAFDNYPQLHILEASSLGWQERFRLRSDRGLLKHNVTCMALVDGDAVWLGDHLGYVHSYSALTYERLFEYKMEPDALEVPSPVRAIHFLSGMRRACVAMHNGRMFLCDAAVRPATQEGCEGTFVITELGSSTCIHSVTSLTRVKDPKSGQKAATELWCGESHGSVAVFSLLEGVVASQEMANHNDPVVENLEVLEIIANEDGTGVWTFVYPGYHVFGWNVADRKVIHRLDCSKLVPTSESLKTIAIDEHFSPGRCQIASMTVQNGKLYAGTSWGCLVVADAATLRPIAIFRPFADEIQALIPITEKTDVNGARNHQQKQPLLVSLGRGYRSLIGRFVTGRRDQQASSSSPYEVEEARNMSAIIWRPDEWVCH